MNMNYLLGGEGCCWRGSGVSQCCADTETSSCVTHLNEQPWLDTHCQSLAYRGLHAGRDCCFPQKWAVSPSCVDVGSVFQWSPSESNMNDCLHTHTNHLRSIFPPGLFFPVTFTPRVKQPRTNQLQFTATLLFHGESRVALTYQQSSRVVYAVVVQTWPRTRS